MYRVEKDGRKSHDKAGEGTYGKCFEFSIGKAVKPSSIGTDHLDDLGRTQEL